MSVRIALDAMGGDQGPEVLVAGAVQAVNARDDLEITLLGDEERLKDALRLQSCASPDRLRGRSRSGAVS